MSGSRPSHRTPHLPTFAARAVVLAAVWWVVSTGAPDSWIVGVPAVLLAAALDSSRTGPVFRWWRIDHVGRFALFYLTHAIRGGLDVAWRALDPRRSVDPGFVSYRLGLPPGPARSLLIVTVSMLPGTVAAEVEGRQLIVQRIHSGIPVVPGCRRAEELVARLFGLSLTGRSRSIRRGPDDA